MGDFRFVDITPLLLRAGHQYTVAGYYTTTEDPIVYASQPDIAVQPEISVLHGTYTFPSSQLELPTTTGSAIFVGADFRIGEQAQVPEPSISIFALVAGCAGLLNRRRRPSAASRIGIG